MLLILPRTRMLMSVAASLRQAAVLAGLLHHRTTRFAVRLTMPRCLYLAAYDIPCRKRRAAALAILRGYATGGQKSVHEIFASTRERASLLQTVSMLLDERYDRFFLVRLDPRSATLTIGAASQPVDQRIFFLG
jgi:CRISPR-associated protein Cas2